MSISIIPGQTPASGAAAQPKKKVFGLGSASGLTRTENKGVFVGNAPDLAQLVDRVAQGPWYSGGRELQNVMESYVNAIAGDRMYGSDQGAAFGFIGHLARRLPAPILFDHKGIAEFIFRGNTPTAAMDTSGRMWVYAGFLEECLREEARDKTIVLPLMVHEYLHSALNHNKRMHDFPPDISNQAKDKVINPMGAKMFSDRVQASFSDIFKMAHGMCPEDKKYEGLSEETVAKLMMQEMRKRLEEKGTLRIKKLIVEDGPVTKINTLSAGRDEIKEYDTITVKVQDMGMMDKVDTVFDCANLEIDEIDNRLKVRKRPGAGDDAQDQPPGPIEIPVESDSPNGKGKPSGQGNSPANPPKGSGSQGGQQDKNQDAGNDNDPGRKSLDDVRKDIAKQRGQGAGSSQGQDAGQDPGQSTGQGAQNGQKGQQAAGQAGGQQPGSQGAGQSQDQGPQGSGSQGSQPAGAQGGQGQSSGAASQGAQNGASAANGNQAGAPQSGPGQNQQSASGSQPGRVNAGSAQDGQGRPDPQQGGQIGDPNSGGVNNGKGGFSGSPDDILGGLGVRDNPLNTKVGHEVDLAELAEWLAENGFKELVGKMRADDFDDSAVDRAVEISLKEAEKERLIIGSGYAGGHVEDYMHTVVRPNSLYKVNWLRKAVDFVQGTGQDIASTLDEYGVLTYVDPQDMGFPEDDGVYYPGNVLQKPEGVYGVIIDTSGSIWSDKKRLGHLAAFALGIRNTRDDMSPDVLIVGADTVVSGKPQFFDEESIIEAVEKGIALGGGGGTDYAMPINQFLAWCKENDKKPLGILYLGDFEVRPPQREELPEDLPPVMFGGMPHDVVRADSFIKSVSDWADVFTIEDDITLDAIAAEEKAQASRGRGHNNLDV